MKKIFFFLGAVLLLAALFFTKSAFAQGIVLRDSPRLMQGIRPLGMGGAFLAVDGTDENALFYNPAAINDFEKKAHMQFLLPTIELSSGAVSLVKDDVPNLIDDIDGASSTPEKVDIFNNFVDANNNRMEEVGVHGSIVSFMHKYVAASLFYENRTAVRLTTPTTQTLDVEALSQVGLQVGTAYAFFDDVLQVGVAAKFIERHLIDETLTEDDVTANPDNFSDSFQFEEFGFGVGFDAGIKFHAPIHDVKAWDYLKPVFAMTIQDIADTRFSNSANVGRTPQSVSAGFAIHPNFWKFKSIFDMDVRDLDHDTSFITKLNAGYEITLPISKKVTGVSARIGVNQGYLTGGFGLDLRYFKINAATWGREQGLGSRENESRMYGFQLAAGF